MDPRLDPAPVVRTFAEAVEARVLGLYAGGSLAAGDFQPGISDLDLAAVIAAPLDQRGQHELHTLHEGFHGDHASAAKLHCVYVPCGDAADIDRPHLTWAHGEIYQRPLSGIARAELLRDGITVSGPPPSTFLPPIDAAALKAAAAAELTGYWAGAVTKPALWRQDVYVDLGLITLARAEATIREGRLITKREALTRLHRFGVDEDLAQQIMLRRYGTPLALDERERIRRAYVVRRLVADGIRILTG